ncbi:numb-associated kinase isoform a [Anaeramoeba flamelloides]|uniref:non-specific serine/threonine protein kinase n=1 Tax=Anaeramoeba flamelloides TaxID=1746091 RepID=A0AAV7YPX4_9EUKA|nr:numb-associated kinase isoform a [Anaeramoeba flamelloides]
MSFLSRIGKKIASTTSTLLVNSTIGKVITITERQIKIVELIAEGGFGFVYKAVDLQSNQIFAVKKLLYSSKTELELITTEVRMHKLVCKKRTIISIYGAEKVKEDNNYFVYILMEYCPDNLINSMNAKLKQNSCFSEKVVLQIFSRVCDAVCAMHTLDPPMIHRDLKCENLLISQKGKIKLCDFGSATYKIYTLKNKTERYEAEEDIEKNTTLAYRAPEMIDLFLRQKIDTKSDIWALGCILFKLLFFEDAFNEGSTLQILNKAYRIPTKHNYRKEVIDLIPFMLISDPAERPDIHEVIKKLTPLLSQNQNINKENLNETNINSNSTKFNKFQNENQKQKQKENHIKKQKNTTNTKNSPIISPNFNPKFEQNFKQNIKKNSKPNISKKKAPPLKNEKLFDEEKNDNSNIEIKKNDSNIKSLKSNFQNFDPFNNMKFKQSISKEMNNEKKNNNNNNNNGGGDNNDNHDNNKSNRNNNNNNNNNNSTDNNKENENDIIKKKGIIKKEGEKNNKENINIDKEEEENIEKKETEKNNDELEKNLSKENNIYNPKENEIYDPMKTDSSDQEDLEFSKTQNFEIENNNNEDNYNPFENEEFFQESFEEKFQNDEDNFGNFVQTENRFESINNTQNKSTHNFTYFGIENNGYIEDVSEEQNSSQENSNEEQDGNEFRNKDGKFFEKIIQQEQKLEQKSLLYTNDFDLELFSLTSEEENENENQNEREIEKKDVKEKKIENMNDKETTSSEKKKSKNPFLQDSNSKTSYNPFKIDSADKVDLFSDEDENESIIAQTNKSYFNDVHLNVDDDSFENYGSFISCSEEITDSTNSFNPFKNQVNNLQETNLENNEQEQESLKSKKKLQNESLIQKESIPENDNNIFKQSNKEENKENNIYNPFQQGSSYPKENEIYDPMKTDSSDQEDLEFSKTQKFEIEHNNNENNYNPFENNQFSQENVENYNPFNSQNNEQNSNNNNNNNNNNSNNENNFNPFLNENKNQNTETSDWDNNNNNTNNDENNFNPFHQNDKEFNQDFNQQQGEQLQQTYEDVDEKEKKGETCNPFLENLNQNNDNKTQESTYKRNITNNFNPFLNGSFQQNEPDQNVQINEKMEDKLSDDEDNFNSKIIDKKTPIIVIVPDLTEEKKIIFKNIQNKNKKKIQTSTNQTIKLSSISTQLLSNTEMESLCLQYLTSKMISKDLETQNNIIIITWQKYQNSEISEIKNLFVTATKTPIELNPIINLKFLNLLMLLIQEGSPNAIPDIMKQMGIIVRLKKKLNVFQEPRKIHSLFGSIFVDLLIQKINLHLKIPVFEGNFSLDTYLTELYTQNIFSPMIGSGVISISSLKLILPYYGMLLLYLEKAINPKFQNLKKGIDSCQLLCLITIINEAIYVYKIITFIISRLHCTNIIENLSKNKLYNRFIKLFHKQTHLFEKIFNFDFLKKYLIDVDYPKKIPQITKTMKAWEKFTYPVSVNENILLLKPKYINKINNSVIFQPINISNYDNNINTPKEK